MCVKLINTRFFKYIKLSKNILKLITNFKTNDKVVRR